MEHLHEFLVGFALITLGHVGSAIWMAATMRSELKQRKSDAIKMEQRFSDAQESHRGMIAEAKREHTEAIREHTRAINEMRIGIETLARTYGERLVAIETRWELIRGRFRDADDDLQ